MQANKSWAGWVTVAAVVAAACSSSRPITQLDGAHAIRWEAPVLVAEGGGERGPWQQNDSRFDYVDDGSVAFAPDGTLVVAWVDQGRKDIFVQRRDRAGEPLGPALDLSRSPDVFSWLPRIAINGDDVLVLWQEIVFSGGSHGGEAYFARSRDGGATFEASLNLSRSRNGDGKGRISRDVWHNGSIDLAAHGDRVLATWTEYDGALWVARSLDRGATFEPLVRIDDDRPARAPALAISGDRVILAWSVGEDPSANIRIALSTDGGAAFAPAQLLARTRAFSDAPKLVVDDGGIVHAAWAEGTGGPFGRHTVVYARSRDGGASFDSHRALSPPGSPHAGSFPMLGVDGTDVVVVWEPAANARERSRGLVIAHSRDGGASFTPPALIPGSVDEDGGFNGSHQGRLMEKLAVQRGRIAVANSALAHDRGSRVWLVQGTLSGATSASPGAAGVSTPAQWNEVRR